MPKYDEEKTPLNVSVKDLSSDTESIASTESKNRGGYAAIDGLSDEFSGLSDRDAEILRQQVVVPNISSSFFRLYRYANSNDKILLSVGVLASVLEGLMRPLMSFVFGFATQDFTDLGSMVRTPSYFNSSYYKDMESSYTNKTAGMTYNETSGYWYYTPSNESYYNNYTSEYEYYSMDSSEFVRSISRNALFLALIGVAVVLLTYIKSFIFIDRAEVLSSRIREQYLAATLRQNIGYFDKLGAGEITTRISSDTVLMQDALSEKISYVISHSTTFIGSIAVAYSQSYILTSIILGNVAAIIATSFIGSWAITKYAEKSQDSYGVGATLAEEAISSVRNVQAFGIQERMVQAYDKFLVIAEKYNIKVGYASALQTGFTHLFAFGIDSLAYYQGTYHYTTGELSVGVIMTVIMTLFQGAFSFTIISPYLANIATGLAASTKIFATIDRKSAIDSSSEAGKRLEKVEGHIELRNVRFIYPSRPNVTVLDNYSLDIPAGETIALVGSSGSGKSTIIGLIERFYNPLSGQIFLDGHDIMDLNTRWLRQNIALVSQEPSLFACSIFDNIAFGLIGTKYETASKSEKMELVVEACKQANAWDFINNMPDKLETQVGERGFLMSGGQKQRIAIARAIVSNPRILLLDEATSALDTKSEGVVQEALDRASKNRTTIVIAHRLSTIKDADRIVVMRSGVILEQGTHEELIAKKTEYYGLVQAQSIDGADNSTAASDSSDSEENSSVDFNEKGIPLTKYNTNLALAKIKTGKSVAISSYAAEEKAEKPLASAIDILRMLFNIGRSDLTSLLIGLYSGGITGVAYIGMSFLYGTALQAFQRYGMPFYFDTLRRTLYPLAAFMFMHGIILFFSNAIAGSFLGYSSSRLVRKIREMSFRQLLRQDISYFDEGEHTVGALTSSLTSDSQAIDALGGETTNKMVESLVILGAGSIVSLIIGWKLALVMFGTIPIILVVGYFRFKYLSNFIEQTKNENSSSSDYACEATSAIRTVISLTREQEIMGRYHDSLEKMVKSNRRANNKSALLDGIARGMQYFIMALGFWFGGLLVASGEYTLFQFFFVFVLVVFGSETSTTVFTFAPEMGKALRAGRSIKELLEAVPEIDATSTEGSMLNPTEVNGEIEFKDVHFRYPTRLEVPVLAGLNLKVKKGQFIALVGASGCGKSTTIGLIESFYRPQRGAVLLDGVNVSELNVSSYRSNIALVQQEPVLYAGSIKYNVSLGSLHAVTDEEVEAACRAANVHDFIMSLPEAYDTMCGAKGMLLSGGQKQRIAIARALIRKPKVLLLDEATSALDSESEKVVQAALDSASKGRTTIAVAHRLSTIQNADIIYVFHAGRIAESGTHQQLLALKGRYFELVKLQALEN
ncbi:P-loop containing nucleoside triphosphate hydrolase protein [Limtongia smithiae]|uniref:P-loop containing nucleoside triphosphate hydrolase protein n=1 Tax=Limtongia smithiae TaxID=1125753 RepID=UPI0034CD589E